MDHEKLNSLASSIDQSTIDLLGELFEVENEKIVELPIATRKLMYGLHQQFVERNQIVGIRHRLPLPSAANWLDSMRSSDAQAILDMDKSAGVEFRARRSEL